MAQISQSTLRNRLLRALSAEDFGLVQPHLGEVALKQGDVLIEPNEPRRPA